MFKTFYRTILYGATLYEPLSQIAAGDPWLQSLITDRCGAERQEVKKCTKKKCQKRKSKQNKTETICTVQVPIEVLPSQITLAGELLKFLL